MVSIPLHCEMLIDQNLYIGGDPVGHSCSNPAAFETKEGYLLCQGCKKLWDNESHRLTLPNMFGKEYQLRVIHSIMKNQER